MTSRLQPKGAEVDFDQLSAYLRALGIRNRLELLRKLQLPRTSREILLTPVRHDEGQSMERPLTRQTVEEHLGKLRDLGLVHARAARRDGRAVTEYELNHARLFVIADELRRLCLIQPQGSLRAETMGAESRGNGPERKPTADAEGLALVLVNGPREGQAFPLEGAGPWVVGRTPGQAVALTYDPFVSRENARVLREGQGFAVEAGKARNGTRRNWAELAAGERVPLRGGDVLGVGRSLLVFRTPG